MISVAIAAYKGEKYLGAQLDSILSQISETDEIVLSDDAPGGETEKLVAGYISRFPNIRYIEGRGEGLIKNFENALTHCRGDIIFLSDQDDVWLDGKVEKVMRAVNDGALLVLHDCAETDESLKVLHPSYFALRGSKPGVLSNIAKNSYMGCCMAFRRELLDQALPFPDALPMHDQWLGLLAEKSGKVSFLSEPLIYHRLHGDNMTGGKTSLSDKIRWRANLILALKQRGVQL